MNRIYLTPVNTFTLNASQVQAILGQIYLMGYGKGVINMPEPNVVRANAAPFGVVFTGLPLSFTTSLSVLDPNLLPWTDNTSNSGSSAITAYDFIQTSYVEGSKSLADIPVSSKRYADSGDKVLIICQRSDVIAIRQSIDVDRVIPFSRKSSLASAPTNDIYLVEGRSRINELPSDTNPILITDALPDRNIFIIGQNWDDAIPPAFKHC